MFDGDEKAVRNLEHISQIIWQPKHQFGVISDEDYVLLCNNVAKQFRRKGLTVSVFENPTVIRRLLSRNPLRIFAHILNFEKLHSFTFIFVADCVRLSSFVFTARMQSAALRLLVVCPSVTLVDQHHIGWKSWKLIARAISPTPSLFVAQKPSTYSQGNMGKFGGD